jgi:glycosyltransferase involved in cell wall biosynthesis
VKIACLRRPGATLLGVWCALRRHLRTAGPDVVAAYLAAPCVVTSLIAPRRGGPAVVWSVRDSGVPKRYGLRHGLVPQAARVLSRRADLIVANSHAGARHYVESGYPADRVVVVPNGIDVDLFDGSAKRRAAARTQFGVGDHHCVVGLLARFDVMKGHDDVLIAGVAVALRDDRIVIVVVGVPESSMEQLNRTVAPHQDRFRFLPATTEPATVLAGFDVLVMSSRFGEGFPNVVGEALASGRPVVVTDTGDAALVADRFGLVVPPADPEALADAIIEVVDHPDRFGTPGERRAHVQQHYSVEQLADRTIEAFELAVERRRSRA